MRLSLSPWTVVRTASALTLAAAMGTAGASGFQIRELSATASGNAMAGATAGAESISYMAFNPAAIGRLDGTRIATSVGLIFAQFEVNNAEAENAVGTPLGGDSTGEGGTNAVVPSLYAKWDLREDLRLGLAITAPYGLATEYDEDWAGRYHAVESDLKTINVNPVLAFKPTPDLTLAGGLVAQYADATLSSAIDFGTLGAGAAIANPAVAGAFGALGITPIPGQQDGFVEITGDDWGFGFNLGLLWQFSDRTRVGLAYESEISHTLEGEADFEADDAGIANVLGASGAFQDTGGTASLDTPAVVSAGVFHQLNDRWQVMGEVSWTQWSSFDELVVEFDNPAQPDNVTEENWDNTFMVSVGANYLLNDRWTLRGGVGFDQSPVPDAEHRTPRIPDSDRTWAGLGFTWEGPDRLSVSASYIHVFFDDSEIDIPATGHNAARGSFTGDAEASVDILSAQVAWRF